MAPNRSSFHSPQLMHLFMIGKGVLMGIIGILFFSRSCVSRISCSYSSFFLFFLLPFSLPCSLPESTQRSPFSFDCLSFVLPFNSEQASSFLLFHWFLKTPSQLFYSISHILGCNCLFIFLLKFFCISYKYKEVWSIGFISSSKTFGKDTLRGCCELHKTSHEQTHVVRIAPS